jgi:hypothetical protein
MNRCRGTMHKIPNRKGRRILLLLSRISCFQPLFLMAKQTPIPDTKNSRGILQIFNMDMGTQRESRDLSFCMKPINTPHGRNTKPMWYRISNPMAMTLSQSISYLRSAVFISLVFYFYF